MGCELVRFTGGGEPTLHPDFADLVALAADAGMRVAVTTNGTTLDRLDPACLGRLAELTVSLWCATPATYSRLHPNKTGRTFERIVGELHRLGAMGRANGRPQLVIANVVGMMNHHELEAMVELAVAVGAARVYFAVVDPVPGCTDGLLLSDTVAADLLARARAAFDRWRGTIVVDNEAGFLRRLADNDPTAGRYDRAAVDEVPCLVGWGFLRILADGSVVPCCRAVATPMGHLERSSLAEIWSSPRYQEFRAHADVAKRDPYFAAIRCDLSCDNLMHNRAWAAALGPGEVRGFR
jgi:MoaA/NifB/PqqE/SkfB family radical SAM enzyme